MSATKSRTGRVAILWRDPIDRGSDNIRTLVHAGRYTRTYLRNGIDWRVGKVVFVKTMQEAEEGLSKGDSTHYAVPVAIAKELTSFEFDNN